MIEAFSAADVTKIGVGVIVAVVVIGVLLSLLITRLIARVVILVVVIALVALVWQQRTAIENKISKQKCQLSATFFGMHLDAPKDVRHYCRHHLGRD